MGKGKANFSRGDHVALLACLAFAWPRLAFPATLPNPPSAPLSSASQTSSSQNDAAADSQPDAAVEFLGNPAGEQKTEDKKSDAPAAADAPAKKSMFSSMRFAPIGLRVSGGVGYSFIRQASGAEPASIQEVLTTNLDVYATSYIWQPWFAKMEGLMRYSNNLTTSSRGGTAASVPNSTVFGDAKLRVFPYSRYPFEASISQSEAFTGYGTGAPNSQTNMLRLSQRYSPRDRKEAYMASLTRTISGGMGLARDREDALDFDASTGRFAKQSHALVGASNRKLGSNGSTSLMNRLVSRHNYTPDSTFSLNGMGNVSFSSAHFQNLTANTGNVQLSTFASWMPKDQPYYLSSSLRGYGFNSSGTAGAAMRRTVDANLSGVYTVNEYLRLDASGNVGMANNNGTRTQTANLGSSQTANVNYPLPSINFGDLRYSRGVSGSFINRNSTTGRHATQTVAVNPQHALSRNMGLMGGLLGLNLNQGLGLSKASHSASRATLTHQGRANWGRTQGQQTSTVTLGITDQRTLAGQKSFFQMVNLQANLNTELDHNSSWNGNLTLQTGRNGNDQVTSPFISSSSASIGYKNRRMFNINRMDFKSDLRMTSKSLMPVLAGTKDQGELSWTNNLTYSLGRLQLSLQGNVTQSQNQTNTLLMFTAYRSFGATR